MTHHQTETKKKEQQQPKIFFFPSSSSLSVPARAFHFWRNRAGRHVIYEYCLFFFLLLHTGPCFWLLILFALQSVRGQLLSFSHFKSSCRRCCAHQVCSSKMVMTSWCKFASIGPVSDVATKRLWHIRVRLVIKYLEWLNWPHLCPAGFMLCI